MTILEKMARAIIEEALMVIEMHPARIAYAAGLGVSEWESFADEDTLAISTRGHAWLEGKMNNTNEYGHSEEYNDDLAYSPMRQLRLERENVELRRRLEEWEDRALEYARALDGRNEK